MRTIGSQDGWTDSILTLTCPVSSKRSTMYREGVRVAMSDAAIISVSKVDHKVGRMRSVCV